jgi:NADPH2:quinone reductase
MFVSFGSSSGPITAFDIGLLLQKGALFATRPSLVAYAATRADLLRMADEMFALVTGGKIVSEAGQTYALKDATQAHRDLESRKTTGATLLLP